MRYISGRKLKKAIKRIKHLPHNKNLLLYIYNKIKSVFYKLIRSNKVAYPSTIMIELNNHCNLHCTTCPREYEYGKEMDKGFISINQAKKIIDELWPYLDSVGLTGMGETLLFKEIEEVVDYIRTKNKGIIISLSTNAMLPDFIAKIKVLIDKVDTIQVSIDGLNDVYESIRINASFKTLDGNLHELAKLCTNTNTSIILNMVVTKENYHHMFEMIGYINEIKLKYLNFTLFNLSSVTSIDSSYYDFFKSPAFINELKKIASEVPLHKNIEITNWDFKSKNEFKKCPFPWSHFYICWNGYITPCCSKPFPKELNFGNVFQSNVLSSLNSTTFKSFRKLWFKNQAPPFCKKCHFIDIEPIDLN